VVHRAGDGTPQVSIPVIAEFLTFLFGTIKLTPGTIQGYRTAIADFLRFHSDIVVSNSVHLSKLISSFYRDQPRKKGICPKWDLSLVLRVLTKEPFEPMHTACLKFVTWKTAFLILLASGNRSSEIHALEFSSLKFQENFKSAVMEPVPEFKAKTANRNAKSQRLEVLKIPALAQFVGSDLSDDRKLCPVRALKIYRSRSEAQRRRSGARRLFIAYKPGFTGDIMKNTFSGWIKALIKFAYANSNRSIIQLTQSRVHEVRALAALVA